MSPFMSCRNLSTTADPRASRSGRSRISLGRVLLVLGVALCVAGCTPSGGKNSAAEPQRVTLNTQGRALFADTFLVGNNVWTTYQIAREDTLVDGKHLYLRKFDRNLKPISGEKRVIDVDQPLIDPRNPDHRFSFQGDLGDHKLTIMGKSIYMVLALKGPSTHPAAVLKFDRDFRLMESPRYLGDASVRPTDMGFCNDGKHLYVQMFYQPVDNPHDPDEWAAKIYKLDSSLEILRENRVDPDETPGGAVFLTGSSIVFVPSGMMGAREDQLQCFSVDAPYGEQGTRIQTFALRAADLSLIAGSRRTLIENENGLDCYFPTRPSWNRKHQLWVVGYTVEPYRGAHPPLELGPSYVELFDARWNSKRRIPLNRGAHAFRVMTRTEGNDLYVAYDEMEADGSSVHSDAKLERHRIGARR